MVIITTILDVSMIITGVCLSEIVVLGSFGQRRVLLFAILSAIIYILVGIRYKAFSLEVITSRSRSMRRAMASFAASVIALISISFLIKASDELSRGISIFGCIAGCILLSLSRTWIANYALKVLNGSKENEIVLVDGLLPPENCTAFKVDTQALLLRPDINDPVMLDRIGALIRDADRVVVSCLPDRRAEWSLALKGSGMNVEVLAPELDVFGAITPRRYYGTATALVSTGPLNLVDRITKRAFDLSVAVVAVVMLTPLFLFIALLIKLDSPGPILFVQKRIGQGNRMFRMYKFRSMRADELDHSANRLTSRNDNRVTKVGKLIRKTSIDELPQIFNVLRGEMSLVGPRPHAIGALAGKDLYWEVTNKYWSRHAVKPGLTGLAQVKGFRGNTETGEDLINRLNEDLAYLSEWSIWRDISLVIQTFGVLSHKNAF